MTYTDYDVTKDSEALKKMMELTGGQRAVPVITVDGELMVGFDRGKLQRLLGLT